MNKTQREYAISRARNIIISKYPKKDMERPSLEDIGLVLGFPKKTHNKISIRYNFKEDTLEHHPEFNEYRKAKKQIDQYNEKIAKKVYEETLKAKDFIMLGDSAEVMEYLKALEAGSR